MTIKLCTQQLFYILNILPAAALILRKCLEYIFFDRKQYLQKFNFFTLLIIEILGIHILLTKKKFKENFSVHKRAIPLAAI